MCEKSATHKITFYNAIWCHSFLLAIVAYFFTKIFCVVLLRKSTFKGDQTSRLFYNFFYYVNCNRIYVTKVAMFLCNYTSPELCKYVAVSCHQLAIRYLHITTALFAFRLTNYIEVVTLLFLSNIELLLISSLQKLFHTL